MLKFVYLEIDILALAILVILIVFLTRRKMTRYEHDQRMFIAMLVCNGILLVTDCLAWMFDGIPGSGIRVLLYFVNWLYIALNGIICMLWMFYCDYMMMSDLARLKKLFIPYILPCFAIIVIVTVSLFNHCIFYIDENNTYQRGDLTSLLTMSYIYFICTTILILKRKKDDGGTRENSRYVSLLAFPIPAIIGSLLQLFQYGLTLTWTVTSISFLVVFLSTQNTQISTDPLTGLYNRGKIDSTLAWRVRMHNIGNEKGMQLFIMILDINKFKTINDRFGHQSGDIALIQAATIIKNATRESNDFAGRFGGDEFMVIGARQEISEIDKMKRKLKEEFEKFNQTANMPYELTASIGVAILGKDGVDDVDSMLFISDKKMYEEKQNFL